MDKILLIFMLVEILATVVECNTVPDITVKPNEDNTTMTTVNSDGDKCALENGKIKDKKLGQGSVQPGTSSPQVLFEVKLLKNELMLLRGDVERLASIESRVDCLTSLKAYVAVIDKKLEKLESKLNGIENYPSNLIDNSLFSGLEGRLNSLENKLDNNLENLIDQKIIQININVTTLTKLMVALENRETEDKYSIEGLKRDLTLLHRGFVGEKQSTHLKLKQIDADMKNMADGILQNVSQRVSAKFENLTQHMTDIDKSVNKCEQTVENLGPDVEHMRKSIKENKQTVQKLGAEVEELQNITVALQIEDTKISKEITALEKNHDNMESKLQTLTNDTAMINGSCNEVLGMTQGKVTFSALVKERQQSQQVSGTLVFDQLVSQTGSGYNVTTGVFTCPESGMYLFSVNITWNSNIQSNYRLKVQLMVDSVLHTYIKREWSSAQASTIVTLALQKDQKVQVNVYHRYSTLYTTYFKDSSFSGGQLFRT